MSSYSDKPKQRVIVLGAGVIGLTTALVLQRSGKYQVLIVSEFKVNPPSPSSNSTTIDGFEFHDPTTVPALEMASPYSGSHWRSLATNEDTDLQKKELFTYQTFMNLTGSDPSAPVKKIDGLDLYFRKNTNSNWHYKHVQQFRLLSPDELPKGIKEGASYKTLVINSPKYMVWLYDQYINAGGFFKQARVSRLRDLEDFESQFYNDGRNSSSYTSDLHIINCSALGSGKLTDVNDRLMHPVRGQVVLVYAPQVSRTVTRIGGKFMRYVIPRGDGTVILGGTHLAYDYNEKPDDETTAEILRETLELTPELVEHTSTMDPEARVAELQKKVLAVKVGFRPGRIGGVRLEHDKFYGKSGNLIKVIHNYGHNGFGIQSSWGYANAVYSMLQKSKL
ncbi:hypothetical protein BB560_005601 [Smittium megazygosporum]|uniref:FAD dependent oxidoreductase domain-containing protein n=1 Tax=Smittium megazygosporum TaxID=133381 RepID=A0A2T9Z2R0_9FUNG|nr:hypothetical protein BB560_005601 [Smittium megazygosporum]